MVWVAGVAKRIGAILQYVLLQKSFGSTRDTQMPYCGTRYDDGSGCTGHLERIHGTKEDRVNGPFYLTKKRLAHADTGNDARECPINLSLVNVSLCHFSIHSKPIGRSVGANSPVDTSQQ